MIDCPATLNTNFKALEAAFHSGVNYRTSIESAPRVKIFRVPESGRHIEISEGYRIFVIDFLKEIIRRGSRLKASDKNFLSLIFSESVESLNFLS